MSQARSNGAVGFKTLEDVITYFLELVKMSALMVKAQIKW